MKWQRHLENNFLKIIKNIYFGPYYETLAKKFACSDVVSGCSWSTIAKDEVDLFHKISEHAKHVHKMTEIPDEILQKVKSKIQEV